MALKYWKKTGKTTWKQKINSFTFTAKIKKKDLGYVFEADNGLAFLDLKSFKTKSQALRYTKAYMRRN